MFSLRNLVVEKTNQSRTETVAAASRSEISKRLHVVVGRGDTSLKLLCIVVIRFLRKFVIVSLTWASIWHATSSSHAQRSVGPMAKVADFGLSTRKQRRPKQSTKHKRVHTVVLQACTRMS
jgi:hypothetical protein